MVRRIRKFKQLLGALNGFTFKDYDDTIRDINWLQSQSLA